MKREVNLLTMFVPLRCPRWGRRSCQWGSWAKGTEGPVGSWGRPTSQALQEKPLPEPAAAGSAQHPFASLLYST